MFQVPQNLNLGIHFLNQVCMSIMQYHFVLKSVSGSATNAWHFWLSDKTVLKFADLITFSSNTDLFSKVLFYLYTQNYIFAIQCMIVEDYFMHTLTLNSHI